MSNLELASQDNEKILIKRFKEYIESELPGIDADKFLEDIDKTGSAISGSFMVKWITGHSFEYNDIDLYENIDDYYSTVPYISDEFKTNTPMTATLESKHGFKI